MRKKQEFRHRRSWRKKTSESASVSKPWLFLCAWLHRILEVGKPFCLEALRCFPPFLSISLLLFLFNFFPHGAEKTYARAKVKRCGCDFCSFVGAPRLIFCRSGSRIKSRIARGKRFWCRELGTLHLASRWLRHIQLDAFDSIRLKEVEQGERWWRWAEVMVGAGRGSREDKRKHLYCWKLWMTLLFPRSNTLNTSCFHTQHRCNADAE